jgi:hypothetical protein
MTESDVRHGLFTLLVLYTLVGIDLMSPTDAQVQCAVQGWVAWGTAFVLIGFFVLPAGSPQLPTSRQSVRN